MHPRGRMFSILKFLVGIVMLCVMVPPFAFSLPRWDTFQTDSSSTAAANAYFPSGTVDGYADYFSSYLNSIGEPKLTNVKQNPKALVYRLDFLSWGNGRWLIVRISFEPDGTARIETTVQSNAIGSPHKAEISVSTDNAKGFLRMVDKSDFWEMPSLRPDNESEKGKVYKPDSDIWIFEGVRNGGYHVVFRRGPDSSPFTEMVEFLAKNLAGLDDTTIPHANSN